MPCTQVVFVDWPIPWVEIDQNNVFYHYSFCSGGGIRYVPTGGWEVGARPDTITLTLDASIASPTQTFVVYDTSGTIIGTAPIGVPEGVSTKVISMAFGALDIGYMFSEYIRTDGTLLITAIDGSAIPSSIPSFWQNFHGQREVS